MTLKKVDHMDEDHCTALLKDRLDGKEGKDGDNLIQRSLSKSWEKLSTG